MPEPGRGRLDGMTRGTVFSAGDDYPNAEASPGLSPEDARIELLFIESLQIGILAQELGRQRRAGKTPMLPMTHPLRVALDRAERRARQIARQCRDRKIST